MNSVQRAGEDEHLSGKQVRVNAAARFGVFVRYLQGHLFRSEGGSSENVGARAFAQFFALEKRTRALRVLYAPVQINVKNHVLRFVAPRIVSNFGLNANAVFIPRWSAE